MTIPNFVLSLERNQKISASHRKQIAYIAEYFKKSWTHLPEDRNTLLGLPHPYIVPDYQFFTEFFYWDSYFILLGLLLYEDTRELCCGILKNFVYEIERFGKIPNNNTYYALSRSQSPYFALMLDAYLSVYPEDINEKWMSQCVNAALYEYHNVWLANDKRNAYRITPTGLSRYWDIHIDADIFAEYESGWDTTSRFNGKCMETNPIDLNSQLYLYEKFFAWWYEKHKDTKNKKYWERAMEKRVELIKKYSWDEKRKLYVDYNFVSKKKSNFVSAASFFPFFAGYPDQKTAKASLPKLLTILEKQGGIAITEEVSKNASIRNQWDYPHGWAPLQFIAYKALQNYGFTKDAQRIRKKWMTTCDYWFMRDQCFYEKYNVVKIGADVVASTPMRKGFGWTNGIYLQFAMEESALQLKQYPVDVNLSILMKVQQDFLHELENARKKKKTSLSFLTHSLPSIPLIRTGQVFQVLAIGGSVCRKALVEKEKTGIQILHFAEKRQPVFKTRNHFLSFIARELDTRVTTLALNFAYPLQPIFHGGKLDGRLITKSKEHSFAGMIGKIVGKEIEEYLKKTQHRAVTVTVANDAVCLLLSGLANYGWDQLACGIVGTGVNFAFFMAKDTVVNLETANFDKFPQSEEGKEIDETSTAPGKALFEKETSGAYLYKHFNIMLQKKKLPHPQLHSTLELKKLALHDLSTPQALVAKSLIERSACYVACQIAGITLFKKRDLVFIMDGSFFWDDDIYKKSVEKYLKEIIPQYEISFIKIPDSTIVGAARLVS